MLIQRSTHPEVARVSLVVLVLRARGERFACGELGTAR